MPLLTDKDSIRTILRHDPLWSVYALGDLSSRMYDKTQWFTPDLALVLHDYGTSILFATGTGAVREALEHATSPVHLQVQADALAEIERHATVTEKRMMWRMGWADRAGRAGRAGGAVRLASADVPALVKLFADGEAAGESPDFFYPSMVTDGVFFGVYDGATLVAAAGTHLFAPEEGAAAIGNIYTMRDRRGRGLGRVVTSAVLDGVKDIETVGLNVRADNLAALHLYESLGFVRHCPFYEGLAYRR
jgi:ribosomal protein S18 acetylase RimI-like enzyme